MPASVEILGLHEHVVVGLPHVVGAHDTRVAQAAQDARSREHVFAATLSTSLDLAVPR